MAHERRPSLTILMDFLGEQAGFLEYGLSTLTHPQAQFTSSDNSVEIQLKLTTPLKMSCKLLRSSTDKDMTEYTFKNYKDPNVTFMVNMPEPGYYKFMIFAGPTGAAAPKDLPNVFNYLIHCIPMVPKPVYPFPKAEHEWICGCLLYDPLCIVKNNLKDVHFKIKLQHATECELSANGDKFKLEEKGYENDKYWVGRFNLTPYRDIPAKLVVSAHFPGLRGNVDLLTYEISDAKEAVPVDD